MNAIRRDWVPLLCIAAASAWIAACDAPSHDAAAKNDAAPTEPLVTAPRSDPSTGLQIATTAGGISTHYTAQFDGETLVRIDERRDRANAPAAHGTYAFQGARLMRYEGTPLGGSGTLLLEFDLQGKVLTARHGDAPATDEQIGAIRTRAQLLRSHAQAQHASRTHSMQQ